VYLFHYSLFLIAERYIEFIKSIVREMFYISGGLMRYEYGALVE